MSVHAKAIYLFTVCLSKRGVLIAGFSRMGILMSETQGHIQKLFYIYPFVRKEAGGGREGGTLTDWKGRGFPMSCPAG